MRHLPGIPALRDCGIAVAAAVVTVLLCRIALPSRIAGVPPDLPEPDDSATVLRLYDVGDLIRHEVSYRARRGHRPEYFETSPPATRRLEDYAGDELVEGLDGLGWYDVHRWQNRIIVSATAREHEMFERQLYVIRTSMER